MEDLKIRVNNEAESKEAQELFFELGYGRDNGKTKEVCAMDFDFLFAYGNDLDLTHTNDEKLFKRKNHKQISLGELRALVSLHKNPINMDKVLEEVRSDALGLLEDKEWLNTKTYEYKKAVDMGGHSKWIEIPEGAIKARFYPKDPDDLEFENDKQQWWDDEEQSWTDYLKEYADAEKHSRIVWQRHTQPKELPFVDDLPDFLFEDTVNHPSHYASGEIECIDAMEAMLTPEQFIGYLRGNAFKYQWRYENKGGITDLEKAQWYLNKLISRVG